MYANRGEHRKREPAITGGMVERELLGEVDKDAYGERYAERYRNDVYLRYKEAEQLVRESQSYDPSEPEPQFAYDLHAKIVEKLGLGDAYDKVKFFTALSKTHFDVFHGVDAMIDYQDKDEIYTVTLDVTTQPEDSRQIISMQKGKVKADVLLRVPEGGIDIKDDRQRYMELIEVFANDIVAVILQKQTQRAAA